MSEASRVSREEVLAIYPKVAEIVADALGLDVGEIALEKRLIEELRAESIDFLDIVYRLERAFRIKIPRGKIEQEARGDLTPEEFESRGVLTEAALRGLRDYMDEVPAERFATGLTLVEIPLLFTVETFCKAVVRARRQG
jgi:acyl carrier protein